MSTRLLSESVMDHKGNTFMRVTLDASGKKTTKLLTVDQFVRVLENDASAKNDRFHRFGKNRDPLYEGGVGEKGSLAGVFFAPGQKRMVSYRGRHYKVPFPSLVFLFRVNANGASFDKMCYAIADENPSDETILYRYPFGNVSSHGDICFGNIKRSKVMSFEEFDLWIDDFFNSITSDDYYDEGESALNNSGLKQGQLLTRLKKEDAFPVEWLKKTAGREKSLGAAIKELFK